MQRNFITILLIFISTMVFAQTRIEIINTNSLEDGGPKMRRLLGNVIFKHDNTYMYCDSAHNYVENNTLDAYSHVRIKEKGGADIFSDFLNYDASKKIAEVHNNVRLIQNGKTLYTQHLHYDMKNNVSNYYSGGRLVDKTSVLTSEFGYYYSKNKNYYFKKNVVLKDPQYNLYTDTLQYEAANETAVFLGPTNIYAKDSNHVYCEKGWYDTKKDIALFRQHAVVTSKNQIVKGDSLFYDKRKHISRGFRHIEIIDTTEKMTVKGNKTVFFDKLKRGFVTDSALLIMVSGKDTLYLHADTLRIITDTILNQRTVLAYKNVRFFQHQMQGKCDSLSYSTADSTIRMFNDPIIWAEENQMLAQLILLHKSKNQIESMELLNTGLIITEKDSIRFNQILGKKITAYFKDNKIHKAYVQGNAQTIYYGKDDKDGGYVGVNKASSPNLMAYILDNKIKSITFLNTVKDAVFSPITEVSATELRLKGFRWEKYKRPLNQTDIYSWR